MVAKTYDEKKGFDLAVKYEYLTEGNGNGKCLKDAGYETISDATVLQAVAGYLCRQVRRSDILKLNKDKFIESWPTVKEGIFDAVDYFRHHLRVPVSQLLPYNALLVPFSYFFIRNNSNRPTALQNKLLVQYFWWASLTDRFTSGVEAKIAADLKRMDEILKEKAPNYKREEYTIQLEDLLWRWFSTSEAFCKAVLCLYSYFQPRSFESDSIVTLDNSWLKRANSKNYHHFFPKKFLENKGWDTEKANCILNITLVDEYLNKRKIGAQAPSKYLKKFKRSNKNLEETMKSHLINLESFGVWHEDYQTFIEKRGERVLDEIRKRLNPTL
jgi:hypothetical protein